MARSQADYRRSLNPRDQFGRKWAMEIEIATGDSTGGIFPASWTDPLRTPMQYVKLAKNEDGQIELGRCVVHYDTWVVDHERAEQAWYTQLHTNARDVYKRLDPTDVANLERDKYLLDLTGPKPFPSSEVIKRAKGGHKPFLGLEPLNPQDRIDLGMRTLDDMKTAGPVPDEPIVRADDDMTPPDNYASFVSWAFRRNAVHPGDLKAAAALWQEHRKNLQAA